MVEYNHLTNAIANYKHYQKMANIRSDIYLLEKILLNTTINEEDLKNTETHMIQGKIEIFEFYALTSDELAYHQYSEFLETQLELRGYAL